jgi:hypothetical protein
MVEHLLTQFISASTEREACRWESGKGKERQRGARGKRQKRTKRMRKESEIYRRVRKRVRRKDIKKWKNRMKEKVRVKD